MPEQPNRAGENVFAIERFSGLVNTKPLNRLEPGDLAVAVNVDSLDTGDLRRRRGYAQLLTGASHSIWSDGDRCFAVRNGALVEVTRTFSATVLAPLSAPTLPLSFERAMGRYYYSNGVDIGCIDGPARRNWGLRAPRVSAIAEIGGALTKNALYTVTIVAVRADGQESGAVPVGYETSTGGFRVSVDPASVDSDAVALRLYGTKENSDNATVVQDVAPAVASFTFVADPFQDLTAPETEFLAPPPPGQFVALFRGRMLVAAGDTIRPSEPHSYELFDLRKSYRFGARITMLAPLATGCYVGTTDRLVWLPGKEPESFEYEEKLDYGVIESAFSFAPPGVFDKRASAGRAVTFLTKNGWHVGFDGGEVQNLTIDNYALGERRRGSVFVHRQDGYHRVVATAEGAPTDKNTFDAVLKGV